LLIRRRLGIRSRNNIKRAGIVERQRPRLTMSRLDHTAGVSISFGPSASGSSDSLRSRAEFAGIGKRYICRPHTISWL
jgi:hypothetical protein